MNAPRPDPAFWTPARLDKMDAQAEQWMIGWDEETEALVPGPPLQGIGEARQHLYELALDIGVLTEAVRQHFGYPLGYGEVTP